MKALLIKLIHVGKTNLAWDDETYRGVLARLTGKCSAKNCTDAELERVLGYMKDKGFVRKPTLKHGRRPGVAKGHKAILAKIEALLAEANRKWAYAEAMGKRMFDQQKLEWLTTKQLIAVMNALQYDAKRNGRPT
ncbi:MULTISPECIES: gp16 family protein [Serratia]|uniref:Regulatory protein GemA n=1 Tax=Serratia marcescens TaxID=615 RepID=A0A9X8VFU4_SERMA|nr:MULTISPECIES: regulatory protein GemA [Serratia]MBS3893063.1 regulatory protein GemA [Serratia marcescens]